MPKITWTAHRESAKIGTTEDVDDVLAGRAVATGVAVWADEKRAAKKDTKSDTKSKD